MFAEDTSMYDKELAEWFYICGNSQQNDIVSYGLFMKARQKLDTLDPRYAFVVYNNAYWKKAAYGC